MTLQAAAVSALNVVPATSLQRVVPELSSLVRAVAGSPLLARTLSQADLPASAKKSLINDIVGNRFAPETVDAAISILSFADKAKNVPSTLNDALTELVFRSAENMNELPFIGGVLGELAQLVTDNAELRDDLSNPANTDDAKQKLIADILKDFPLLSYLAQGVIAVNHGKDVEDDLIELSNQAAARRNVSVAEISTAVALDETRKQALLSALSQSTGRPVEGRFNVDPDLLGSVSVRIGDEVLDGSIRHRLQQARVALVGAL